MLTDWKMLVGYGAVLSAAVIYALPKIKTAVSDVWDMTKHYVTETKIHSDVTVSTAVTTAGLAITPYHPVVGLSMAALGGLYTVIRVHFGAIEWASGMPGTLDIDSPCEIRMGDPNDHFYVRYISVGAAFEATRIADVNFEFRFTSMSAQEIRAHILANVAVPHFLKEGFDRLGNPDPGALQRHLVMALQGFLAHKYGLRFKDGEYYSLPQATLTDNQRQAKTDLMATKGPLVHRDVGTLNGAVIAHILTQIRTEIPRNRSAPAVHVPP